MKVADQHIIPRDLSMSKIKAFLFPDLEKIDPHLKDIFARQAGTSLFLISALIFAISVFIFGISLVSNIEILVLTRSTIVLVAGMLVILVLHKILRGAKRDLKLLVAAVIFTATWGVAKDIANFDVLFNSYGILYIVVLFIGMIQMPFKPRASLFLGVYCALLYVILWFLLVRPVFGVDWIHRVFGESISGLVQNWFQTHPLSDPVLNRKRYRHPDRSIHQ